MGKTKRGKGSKVMAIVDKNSRPLSLTVTSATPFESTLVEQALEERFCPTKPRRLVGDKAYDSDPLDNRLQARGIELIAPHKRNRKKKKTQDGRKLKHYKQRWRVERFFAWLHNFRRCVVRYERHAENFRAFIHLAAVIMPLRYF